jgi:hypothetical protein
MTVVLNNCVLNNFRHGIPSKVIITPTIGATNLISEGDFSSSTNWYINNSVITIANGVLNFPGTETTYDYAYYSSTISEVTSGVTWCKATFDIASYSSGGIRVFGDRYFQAAGSFISNFRYSAAIIQCNTATTVATIDNACLFPITLSSMFYLRDLSVYDLTFSAVISCIENKNAGIALNVDFASNPQNFVIAYLLENEYGWYLYVDKCVSGTYTNLSATWIASNGSDKELYLKVIKLDTSYSFYINGSLIATITISDSAIISNTLHGFFSTSSSNIFSGIYWGV